MMRVIRYNMGWYVEKATDGVYGFYAGPYRMKDFAVAVAKKHGKGTGKVKAALGHAAMLAGATALMVGNGTLAGIGITLVFALALRLVAGAGPVLVPAVINKPL